MKNKIKVIHTKKINQHESLGFTFVGETKPVIEDSKWDYHYKGLTGFFPKKGKIILGKPDGDIDFEEANF